MTTSDEFPARFRPRSVTDSIDGDNSESGACAALTNIIFDPSTPGILQCRPAVENLNPFTGFNNPSVVSVAAIVNGIVYGLVATSDFPGFDIPFAFDLSSGIFYTVSGITGANIPITQATSGDWIPPTMDMAGALLVVTHPGFTGGGNPFFGWFDLTTPTSPTWNAGNTTTNALAAVPRAVRQFNNRFYFAVDRALSWTDTLSLNRTASTQTIFIGDKSPITALAPMPLATTSQSIIQGLMAFKESFIAQVTGDSTTNNLATNTISETIGTTSPRSITVMPTGMVFRAVDGIRTIQLSGILTDPDPDLALPFIYALFPTRISAGFNNNTYRICVQNGQASGAPFQEYWRDMKRNGWTGPHTFPQDLALPYKSTFILFSNPFSPSIWQSNVVTSSADTFVEVGSTEYVTEDGATPYVTEDGAQQYITSNTGVFINYVTEDGATPYVTEDGAQQYITETIGGNTMEFLYQTVPMTDFDNVYANELINSTLDIALPSNGITYLYSAFNEVYSNLATAILTAPPANAVWGQFLWGFALWGAVAFGLQPKTIPWPIPLVFNRLALSISGNCSSGLKLGSFNMVSKRLKYLLH